MSDTRDVYVDATLSNVSIRYSNQELIAIKMLPMVMVNKDSGKYFKYDRAMYRTDVDDHRAPKTKAKTIDFGLTTDDYALKNYALQGQVGDEERANAANPLQPDIDMAEEVTDRVMLKNETRAAAILFNTSEITNNVTLAGTNQWSDYTNSDPFKDIKTGIATVVKAGGKKPNKFLIGYEVMTHGQEKEGFQDHFFLKPKERAG